MDVVQECVQVFVCALRISWATHSLSLASPELLWEWGIRVSENCCLLGVVWIWDEGKEREAVDSQRDSLQATWAMSTPGYLCPSYCAPGVTVPDFLFFQDSLLSSLLRCHLCYKALPREPGTSHSRLLPSLRICPN